MADGSPQLVFSPTSTREMRLLLLLRCVLFAACASVVSGITETELEQVTEPAVIIASHAYRGGWDLATGRGGGMHRSICCKMLVLYCIHVTVDLICVVSYLQEHSSVCVSISVCVHQCV